MTQIHDHLGVALMVVLLVAVAWSLWTLRHPQHLPALRAYIRLLEVTLLLQALIGLILVVALGQRPQDGLHWLYGAVAVASLPLAELFSRHSTVDERVWFAGASLVAVLVSFRAIVTGG